MRNLAGFSTKTTSEFAQPERSAWPAPRSSSCRRIPLQLGRYNMGVSLPQATNDCFAAGILRQSMTGDGRPDSFGSAPRSALITDDPAESARPRLERDSRADPPRQTRAEIGLNPASRPNPRPPFDSGRVAPDADRMSRFLHRSTVTDGRGHIAPEIIHSRLSTMWPVHVLSHPLIGWSQVQSTRCSRTPVRGRARRTRTNTAAPDRPSPCRGTRSDGRAGRSALSTGPIKDYIWSSPI